MPWNLIFVLPWRDTVWARKMERFLGPVEWFFQSCLGHTRSSKSDNGNVRALYQEEEGKGGGCSNYATWFRSFASFFFLKSWLSHLKIISATITHTGSKEMQNEARPLFCKMDYYYFQRKRDFLCGKRWKERASFFPSPVALIIPILLSARPFRCHESKICFFCVWTPRVRLFPARFEFVIAEESSNFLCPSFFQSRCNESTFSWRKLWEIRASFAPVLFLRLGELKFLKILQSKNIIWHFPLRDIDAQK